MVIYEVALSDKYVSGFPCFATSCGNSSRLAAFRLLIFASTTSSSPCVNCASLMFTWLLTIFEIGSSVNFGDFPSRFLKCTFLKCIRSSWLAAFSLNLAVLVFFLTSFTAYSAIIYYLSLILLIWTPMYSVCTFMYTLASSLYCF